MKLKIGPAWTRFCRPDNSPACVKSGGVSSNRGLIEQAAKQDSGTLLTICQRVDEGPQGSQRPKKEGFTTETRYQA
jgi:hypothetical protein